MFQRLEKAGLLPKPTGTEGDQRRAISEMAKKNALGYLSAALNDLRKHKLGCTACNAWKEVFRLEEQLPCSSGQLHYQAVIDWALLYLFELWQEDKPDGMEVAFPTGIANAIDVAAQRRRCAVMCTNGHSFRVPRHLGRLLCKCPECGDAFDWEPHVPVASSIAGIDSEQHLTEAQAVVNEISDSLSRLL